MLASNGELHRFLHAEIASEEALDVLLFLFRNQQHAWSGEEIRDRLRIAGDATGTSSAIVTRRIELRLAHLAQKQLVRMTAGASTYRYEAPDAKMAAKIAELAAMTEDDRAAAVRMIYLRPRGGADAFADAFGARKARP
jgi:hypothetical protein